MAKEDIAKDKIVNVHVTEGHFGCNVCSDRNYHQTYDKDPEVAVNSFKSKYGVEVNVVNQ